MSASKISEKEPPIDDEPEEQKILKEKIIANIETFKYSREELRTIWKIVKRKWQTGIGND
jgi:hypothetical protein